MDRADTLTVHGFHLRFVGQRKDPNGLWSNFQFEDLLAVIVVPQQLGGSREHRGQTAGIQTEYNRVLAGAVLFEGISVVKRVQTI